MAIVLNGQSQVMRLTLGALASLEAELEAGSLVDLVERFESTQFSSRDVLALLGAGLMGGGCALTRADLMTAQIEGGPMQGARAAAELLARAFVMPSQVTAADP